MLENYDLNGTLLCESIKEGNRSNSHHLNSESNMTQPTVFDMSIYTE